MPIERASQNFSIKGDIFFTTGIYDPAFQSSITLVHKEFATCFTRFPVFIPAKAKSHPTMTVGTGYSSHITHPNSPTTQNVPSAATVTVFLAASDTRLGNTLSHQASSAESQEAIKASFAIRVLSPTGRD